MKLLVVSAFLFSFAGVALGQPLDTPSPTPPPAPKKRTSLTYTPPQKVSSGIRIDGDAGSRGGDNKLPSLFVLTPDHIALTTQAQPSLFWFQNASARTRFELTLIEPKQAKPLLKVATDKEAAVGVHRISLKRHKITLTPGIVYAWTVAFVPDPTNRSKDVIASGKIQRIEPSSELTAELAAAPTEKAAIYAANGLWYDAFEAISDAINAEPNSEDLRGQRAELLRQVGLKETAAALGK